MYTGSVNLIHSPCNRSYSDPEKGAKEDVLTGIYNYSYFTQLAEERIHGLAERFSENVFLFLDVHNFKAFNDQRGFEEGNRFLITIGNRVTELFQDSLCARHADDHFVVLTKSEGLQEKLDALNNLVHEYDKEILMSINCGAYHLNSNSEDPRIAIDRARYAADQIKNRFQTVYAEYDKAMSEQ